MSSYNDHDSTNKKYRSRHVRCTCIMKRLTWQTSTTTATTTDRSGIALGSSRLAINTALTNAILSKTLAWGDTKVVICLTDNHLPFGYHGGATIYSVPADADMKWPKIWAPLLPVTISNRKVAPPLWLPPPCFAHLKIIYILIDTYFQMNSFGIIADIAIDVNVGSSIMSKLLLPHPRSLNLNSRMKRHPCPYWLIQQFRVLYSFPALRYPPHLICDRCLNIAEWWHHRVTPTARWERLLVFCRSYKAWGIRWHILSTPSVEHHNNLRTSEHIISC